MYTAEMRLAAIDDNGKKLAETKYPADRLQPVRHYYLAGLSGSERGLYAVSVNQISNPATPLEVKLIHTDLNNGYYDNVTATVGRLCALDNGLFKDVKHCIDILQIG